MSLRRLAVIVLSAAAALLAGVVLYLAFGDLGRHKGRVETLATELLGRPFAIDGAFELEVLPSISLVAERVRLGNAQWGSQPQMVEIGRVSAQVGLWSLVSGPVDVRSFELTDVAVLLETNGEGKGNWIFGEAGAPAEAAEPGAGSATALPAVILRARLANVRTTYRERGKPDRVALIESLSIAPGSDGLLAIAGKGRLNELPAAVSGELGPLEALFAGRDIRMAIQAALGELQVDVKGGLGRLDPLDGADLGMKIAHPDIGSMLRKLHLPAVVAGPLTADARLADAGDLTRLDIAASLGDITVKVGGTLRALGLPGSDLRIDAAVANVARNAAALEVTSLPAGALELGGRFISSRTEIKLDGLSAKYAGARARVNGTVRLANEPGADLRFELAAESLRRLQSGLPEMPVSVSGNYAGNRNRVEVKNLKGRIGKDEISGRASLVLAGRKRFELELASPRLDVTPFAAAGSGAKPAGDARAKPKPEPKFVFDEAPLPLEKLKVADARLHFRVAEVRLDTEVLRDVESKLLVDGGRLALEARMRDGVEGIVTGAVKLTPSDGGAAALDISLSAKNTRAGLSAGDAFDSRDAPPTNVDASLLARGASARQMASGANGRVLVTQGAGKLNSGLIGLLGGDLLRELVGKLNPFSGQDPYTKLECTVVRADIVDGEMKISPVLLQSEKVTIVAGGEIDLRTEALRFSFNTRPRTGVGVSAGMFTNPFIELAGTLASPRLGLGAKGATSGAAAAATGGISVLAQGFLDRARGGQDLCKKTLELAVAKAK